MEITHASIELAARNYAKADGVSDHRFGHTVNIFISGAEWYREQLAKKEKQLQIENLQKLVCESFSVLCREWHDGSSITAEFNDFMQKRQALIELSGDDVNFDFAATK